jgi:VIT1/CCC1 family predicted Fe2+/Mn2+ transporter
MEADASTAAPYDRRVIRQGPVPAWLHGMLEYAAGVLCIVAPFLFTFQAGSAKATSIVLGVLLLFVAAISDTPVGLVKQLPVAAHVALDFVVVAILIATPFVFGFSDETNPTAFFIALGVVHLLVTVATRYARKEPAAGGADQ